VLVVAALGAPTFAVLGGRLSRRIRDAGATAVVIDGYVRDVDEINDTELAVFARGHNARAAPKTGSGEINVAIACGGAVVAPGDLVFGDNGGVLAIPPGSARSVLGRLRRAHSG